MTTTVSEKIRGTWQIAAIAGVLFMGCSKTDTAPEITDIDQQPDQPSAVYSEPVKTPEPVTVEDDDKAAVVDGKTITVAEVRAVFDDRIAPYRNQIPPDQLETLWQAQMPVMLETAIAQHLIHKEIADREITITDTDIDAKLEEIKQQIPPGHTLEELTGQTSEQIRSSIDEMLAYEKLLEEFDLPLSDPTEEQLREHYDKNIDDYRMPESAQASHILIGLEKDADEETRATRKSKIESIRAELEEGADFAAMAAEHSDCPSGRRGGDLGSFGRGQMVAQFEEAAFSQEKGVIGPVIETKFGYHIVKVLDVQPEHLKSFEEVRDNITAMVKEDAARERTDELLKILRSEADIRYFLP